MITHAYSYPWYPRLRPVQSRFLPLAWAASAFLVTNRLA